MKRDPELHRSAKRYRVSVRTVRRWRADGAPLGDAAKMKQWLAGRRTAPTITGKVKQLETATSSPRPPGGPGAHMALRRLEQSELEAYTRLQTANNSGDPVQIRTALHAYLSLAELLRKTDQSIAEARRDAEEQVSRSTVENMLAGLGWSLRIACDQLGIGDQLTTAVAGLRMSLQNTGLAWPEWMFTALSKEAVSAWQDGEKHLAQRARLMSACCRASVGDRSELDTLIAELGA